MNSASQARLVGIAPVSSMYFGSLESCRFTRRTTCMRPSGKIETYATARFIVDLHRAHRCQPTTPTRASSGRTTCSTCRPSVGTAHDAAGPLPVRRFRADPRWPGVRAWRRVVRASRTDGSGPGPERGTPTSEVVGLTTTDTSTPLPPRLRDQDRSGRRVLACGSMVVAWWEP